MRMGQGVRIGLGHRGITCVLKTKFSSYITFLVTLESSIAFCLSGARELVQGPALGTASRSEAILVKAYADLN